MRIFDCFTFFNEFELLEMRLNELSPVVDKFVLAEATKTHQGKDKPLYFLQNQEKFSAFKDKIIHVVVDHFPENNEQLSWVYERHQRNMLKEGLTDCQPDDVILVSDVDELPRPEKIAEQREFKGIRVFEQNMYYYYLNWVNTTNKREAYHWYGTAMARFGDYRSPQYLRDVSILVLNHKNSNYYGKVANILSRYNQPEMWRSDIRIVKDGGWHFSFLGGAARIIAKIEAFAHKEYNTDEFKDPEAIQQRIGSGKDLFGRAFSYGKVSIDDSFPSYLRKNLGKYAPLISDL
jgi:hypothetical protein